MTNQLRPSASLLSVPLFALASFALQGCEWALQETPQNLKLSVVTVALRPSANDDPALTEAEAQADIARSSKLWEEKCGITLVHQGHYVADAASAGVQYNPLGTDETLAVQSRFYDPHHLAVVYLGDITLDEEIDDPDSEYITIGYGNFPWKEERGAIVVSSWALSPVLTSHEFGHGFGLEHTDEDEWEGHDEENLMYPIDYGYEDLKITQGQCERAKEYILTHEVFSETCRPDSNDPEADRAHHCVRPAVATLGTASSEIVGSEPVFQRPARKRNPNARPRCPRAKVFAPQK